MKLFPKLIAIGILPVLLIVLTAATPNIHPEAAGVGNGRDNTLSAARPNHFDRKPANNAGKVSDNKLFAGFVAAPFFAAPFISYPAGAKVYSLNSAITPLTITNTGGAVPTTSPGTVTTVAGNGTSASTDNAVATSASFRNPAGVVLDASGNIYVVDQNGHKVRKITPAGVVTTLAGSGTSGTLDGTGTAATFFSPSGISIDASGNLYVTDQGGKKIRKVTPAGVVTTLAGSGATGSLDGTGTAATFSGPVGITLDGSGNVYVCDGGGNKIRKITSAGVVTTLAGSGVASSLDGTGTAATFNNLGGIAVDASGNVFVSESVGKKIRKVTPAGVVTTIAGSGATGTLDGTGTAATFNSPYGLAIDASGNLYVADGSGNKIRKISPAGVVTTLAGSGTSGSTDATTGTAATFNLPFSLIEDGSGNIYVADYSSNKIRKISQQGYSISPALPAGLSLDATTGTISGTPTALSAATTYTVTATNTDGSNSTTVNITVSNTPTINITGSLTAFSTCAGTASAAAQSFTVSGNTLTADINITAPTGFEIATTGGVYSNSLTLTQSGGTIAATSVFARLAATATGSPSGSITATSAGATAQSLSLSGTANALPDITIGSINSVLTTATTFTIPYIKNVGSTDLSYSIATGSPTAMSSFAAVSNTTLFRASVSVTIPASAANTYNFNLIVKDNTTACVSVTYPFTLVVTAPLAAPNISYAGSTQVYRISTVITPLPVTNTGGAVSVGGGGVTTFAGSGTSGSTDATGVLASFNDPFAIAVDVSGTLYVADAYGYKVRKITSAGVVTTLAGSGTAGSVDNNNGLLATFNTPSGIAVDGSGNVYVTELGGYKVRKITSAGVVTTLAGSGTVGSADNATGTLATFNSPRAITVDGTGNLYVCDQNKIRKISPSGAVTTLAGTGSAGSLDNATGTLATFSSPYGITIDASGNLYVADNGSNKIRKISTTNAVTTLAGTGTSGSTDNATGTLATFNVPWGIAIDGSGNLYVADRVGRFIRKISPSGAVSTLAGNGLNSSIDNSLATSASFTSPYGLAVNSSGVVYVADGLARKIRQIGTPSGYSISPGLPAGLSLDATTGTISGTPTVTSVATNYTITGTNSSGSSATTINLTVVTATLTVTGSLSYFTTCSGSASTPQSFTVDGSNLTADVNITAPTGFELATTSGGAYSNSLTLPQSSGSVSSAQVFIRLAATATATTVGGPITCTSSSATTKSININSTVTVITTPATPVITGATALTMCSGSSVVLNSNGTAGSQWYLNGNLIANATSSSYTAATGGSYTVISNFADVTKVCYSAASLQAVVTVNSSPTATIGEGSQLAFANCAATTVTLSANTGAGLTYQWINDIGNITGATSQQYSVTQAGNYSVRVTDANNCFAVSSVTKILSISSATANGNTAVCSGATVSLSANATGFTNPTYQWVNNGTAISGATAATYAAAATGNYSVTVTSGGVNSNSCPVSVTVNPLPTITVAASPGNTVCTGTPLSINATVSGTNSYQWLNSGNAISSATLSSLNITASGSYSVKVTDANGCINTSTASALTVNPLPTPSVITGTTAVKATKTTTLLSTPTGGTWSSSNTAVATVSSTGVVTGVAAGVATISYVLTNSGGCSATVTTLVTVTALTPKPTITAGSTTNLCSGGSVVLTSNATGINQWYKDGIVIGGATGGTFTATTAGSYTAAAGVDAVSSDAIRVIVNANPDASIQEGAQLAFSNCATTSITLTAVNIEIGTTYQWRNANGDILNATNQQYTVTQADNYSLRVTDVNNCTATSGNTKITAVPSASSGGSTVVCAGTSVTLSVNASAFTSPTYQWQSGGTNITGATSATYSATTTGNYSVVVTDGVVTSTSCALSATVNALPAVTITANATVCAGTTANLAATTSAVTYQWLNSDNPISSATTSSYAAATTGQYSAQVTDANGCTNKSAASTVTVNPLPVVDVIAGSGTVCEKNTTNFVNTTSGGVWSSSNTAIAKVDVTGVVTGVSAGTATISYTVTTNSCTSAVTKSITVNASSSITTQPVATLAQCPGTNASISVVAAGTNLTYQWYQNGSAISGAILPAYSKTNLVAADAGNYSVIVSGGCSNVTSNASVWTVNPLPVVGSITGSLQACTGATSQLANSLTGGVWSSSNTAVATINATSGLVSGLTAGTATITYTATSAAGCISSVSATLTVNTSPTVTASSSFATISKGLTVQLLAVPVGSIASYSWTPAANLNSATIANPVARVTDNTTYVVTVTSTQGCVGTGSVSVTAVEDFYVQPTNVFTPNGDGINDRFVIKNLDQYPVNNLQVFDRTGKILYEKVNYANEWDGSVAGKILAKDTYFYVLTVKGQIVKKGTITLVR